MNRNVERRANHARMRGLGLMARGIGAMARALGRAHDVVARRLARHDLAAVERRARSR